MSAVRSFTLSSIRATLPAPVPGLLLFTPVALLGNAAGSLLRYPEVGAAVLFAPYAVLVAALFVAPRRHWIWYILAGAVAHFVTHWPQWSVSWVLLADCANVARALTAAVLMRWVFGCTPRLDSVRALSLFAAIAVLLAPAVGATIGATNVVLHRASDFDAAWRAWFMSNALTGLTLLPAFLFALVLARGPRRRLARERVIEVLLLMGALALTLGFAFLLHTESRWHIALLYAPLPVLIWAGLRFGWGGASLALSATVIAAIWGTDRGSGPFSASRDDDILALQLFVVLTALPVLCLAAIGSARRDAVQLFHTLLASLESHVAILDGSGAVLAVNESWSRLADRPDSDAFHEVRAGDHYARICAAAAKNGSATAADILNGLNAVLAHSRRRFETEYDHVYQGRRERYAISVEALERADGGAVVIRTDVTARHRVQREIEEQRRELSHLARVSVLGQFSGALAHELKQPLSSIHNNAEAGMLLLARPATRATEINAILRDILADDRRATQVINRLSALLKRGETRLQSVAPRDLVDDVLDLARAELIARRVTLSAEVVPDTPPILGDRVQLQQVLLNLILNACEAMSSVAASDRRLVLTVDSDDHHHVHVAVRDNGPGIPQALVERLFEPFVTTKPDGLGLGLSISRTIVAAHGGRLWAQNNPDRGATMHCVFAAARATPAPVPS